MVQLIVFRAVQGLGGGGLIVTAMAVIGDLYRHASVASIQGVFGGVFGLSTVMGPLIGGFFVEQLSWRWIFYVNLPLGLVALVIIGWAFSAPGARRRPSIDIAGRRAARATLTALILLASLGGHTIAWTSPAVAEPRYAGRWAALAGFIAVEHVCRRSLSCRSACSPTEFPRSPARSALSSGFALFGSVTFMPMYLQVVKRRQPDAGRHDADADDGRGAHHLNRSGRIISRIGRYRPFPIAGTAMMTMWAVLLATLGTRHQHLDSMLHT